MKTNCRTFSCLRFARVFAMLALVAGMIAGRASVASAQLLDTDSIEDPFIQLNDVNKADKDTFAIRGRVYVNPGADPVAAGLANGATAIVYQAGSALGAFVYVDSESWAPGECKATSGGRSLYCKGTSGSSLRLRGTQSDPTSYRLNAVVKRRDFSPGKPFELPLAGEIQVNSFDWTGQGATDFCSVSNNGERTTCRSSKAGPG